MFMANIADLKARLSELVDRAAKGERIVICRHNRPVAELRAVADVRTEPRPVGPLRGRPTFTLAPQFFEPMPEEELRLWEESPLAVSTAAAKRAPRRPPSRAAERAPSYDAPRRHRKPRS
jgi:prevent-host-death family protein